MHVRDLEARVRHETLVRVWTPRGALDCRGLSGAYDGAADTVVLSVPARCIGAPRVVRLGVKATATPRPYADNPGTVFFLADDGHREGLRENSIGKGPKVRRGRLTAPAAP